MENEAMVIPGAKIVYREDMMAAVKKRWDKILDSGWVILGEETKSFERAWSGYCGRSYGVAVSNDTAALEIALKPQLLNIDGGYMMVPANGFYSVVTALDRTGGKPWFADIDMNNNINFTLQQVMEARSVLGPLLKAVCLMPCGGHVNGDALEIAKYCDANDIWVLEDAAHGHGTEIDGVKVGDIGDIACFSFYATKVLNTAEGGMLLMDDPEWEAEAKLYRNYGRSGNFSISVIIRDANNFRMTEFTAALGLEQTKIVEEIVEERRRVAGRYDACIKLYDDVLRKVPETPNLKSNYYKYMVMLPSGCTHDKKILIKQRTGAKGVHLSGDVYDLPINRQPIYLNRYGNLNFPVAWDFSQRHICMPFYEFMTDAEIARACEVTEEVVKEVLK